MKLFLYDKFWDSFINLPNGIQKKVVDFQGKFRENSKSSAIHLEPIKTFKDQSLRSARIDQTYRAILKVPSSGDAYYLLYIDHHDKAYDWAKNKLFQWNTNTQSMQVFTAPDTIHIAKEKEESTQTDNFLFSRYKDSELKKIGVPDVLLPSIRKIKTLDELEDIENFIPEDVFENLFYLSDGANIDSLITEVQEGLSKIDTDSDQETSLNNQRNFIELTDDTDNLFKEALEGKLDKWKYYLHPSQRKLVNGNFSGSVKVSGGAGTGKTVAALHRLKFLSENQKTDKKILFTTFTKALTNNLIDLAKELNINLSNIEIKNIDEIAYNLVHEFNIYDKKINIFEYGSIKTPEELWENILETELSTYDVEFLQKEYLDVIVYNNVKSLQDYIRTSRVGRGKPINRRQRKEIWKFIEKYKTEKESLGFYHKEEIYNSLHDFLEENELTLYDHCIVDELQDFSNVELRLLRKFVEEKPNDLFFVGDPLQKIYNRKINFTKAGINIRGKKSSRLRINYRTSEEIKKLAISIVKEAHYDNFDGEEEHKNGYISLFHGEKPKYEILKTKQEELDKVINQIENLISNGYEYSEVAICSRTKNGYKDFLTVLHNKNIPYTEFKSGGKIGDQEGIRVLTFHNIKGLEFKQVFLVDVNRRNCPKIFPDFEFLTQDEKENHIRNERSLLYVAVSRAIENVQISGVGNKTSFIEI